MQRKHFTHNPLPLTPQSTAAWGQEWSLWREFMPKGSREQENSTTSDFCSPCWSGPPNSLPILNTDRWWCCLKSPSLCLPLCGADCYACLPWIISPEHLIIYRTRAVATLHSTSSVPTFQVTALTCHYWGQVAAALHPTHWSYIPAIARLLYCSSTSSPKFSVMAWPTVIKAPPAW